MKNPAVEHAKCGGEKRKKKKNEDRLEIRPEESLTHKGSNPLIPDDIQELQLKQHALPGHH